MKWAGCVARSEETRNEYKFWSKNLRGRDVLEDLGVNGKIMSEWEVVDWIHLDHDSDQWQALVKTVMNLRVPTS
jgi:hypothetical protein